MLLIKPYAVWKKEKIAMHDLYMCKIWIMVYIVGFLIWIVLSLTIVDYTIFCVQQKRL